ncbi:MAG: hypothetical protein ABI625_20510 [bacterium]
MSRLARCLPALCAGALLLLVSACAQDTTTSSLAPTASAALDAFPDGCTTTVDCIGEPSAQDVFPEQLVVCKNYPAGVSGPPVNILLEVVSLNKPKSPTRLTYSLQPNSCLRLWFTRGAPASADLVVVRETPVAGYTATSQVTTSIGKKYQHNVTVYPSTSMTTVAGITGGPSLAGMLVVFTNTPVTGQ